MEARRPILLNSCARAATADEARFRIQGPEPVASDARIIALDAGAARVVRRLAEQPWRAARFLTYEPGSPITRENGDAPDVELRTATDGQPLRLSAELDGADMVVMVATAEDGADAAAAIGEACYRRRIMTGGVVFRPGGTGEVRAAVSALRPHAQVLLVTEDEDDVPAVLTALRA